MASTSAPKVILYTNHRCPWAHRAHIALAELGLEYTEEIIDLSTPRTAEYLKINPRGLVPSISYNGEIITESAIVSKFLADAHPSHLVKTSSEPGGALQRARIDFFVDAFFSKVNGAFYALLKAEGAEKEKLGDAYVQNVVKELEPYLQDAAPFFGGSKQLTLVEVLTGSFLLRILGLAKPEYKELNLLPSSMLDGLEAKAPAFWKWANATVAEKSVNFIWDEKLVAEGTAGMVAKMKAAAK
ncbi:glutathione S-transferase domain-containing protein [Drepanopeziza brunnea f. sp. 'multigermtubi' MB_m1]|uniref:Glutathione S-transferase domain-containing protein n=1 Tax=Marssonina brunnea f. sp. multigermtubi (strain MB_m1) TaxID=1072389 RepID=K1WJG3_MARBU|nr:glutathione S-transferase domain-containing protein [Drepanopeziza brunnea f. sp. 'multigermtubi' MB_m1]EKD17800.1 glutathione S-transferase domain-containing protein [Drepanopeziza brunnea f. sp. 'multigermtubi' MB_m1]